MAEVLLRQKAGRAVTARTDGTEVRGEAHVHTYVRMYGARQRHWFVHFALRCALPRGFVFDVRSPLARV